MEYRRRPTSAALAALALLAGCAAEVASEEDVSSSAEPVLGEYTGNHRFNCADDYPPVIADMVFAMRVTAASDDFHQALSDYFTCGGGISAGSCGYWALRREPYSRQPDRVRMERGLHVGRNVNDVEVKCVNFLIGANGRTRQRESHGSYFDQWLKLSDDNRGSYPSTNFRLRMGTIFHELYHTHGYVHRRHGHEQYDHSMPQLARHALQRAFAIADNTLGTHTPSRLLDCEGALCFADGMRGYRDLGYLVFQRPDETVPRYMFDPGRRGIGLLRHTAPDATQFPDVTPRGQSLRLVDAQLYGNRWGRAPGLAFDATWDASDADEVLLAGRMHPGGTPFNTGPGHLLVTRPGGVALVAWGGSAAAGRQPDDFEVLADASWRDVLPAARASARWTLRESDTFVEVSETTVVPPVTHVPPRSLPSFAQEIVVRGEDGIAFLSAYQSRSARLSSRARIAEGEELVAGLLRWQLAADTRVLGVGDFDGNGLRDEVLVADERGMAIVSHRQDSRDAALSSAPELVATQRGSDLYGWYVAGEPQLAAIGDFDADGEDEWVTRDGNGIMLFELDMTGAGAGGFPRIEKRLEVGFGEDVGGSPLASRNELASARLVPGVAGDQLLVLRGGFAGPRVVGLELDRSRLQAVPGAELSFRSWFDPQRAVLESERRGRLEPLEWLRVFRDVRIEAVGDFDADGVDELVLRSDHTSYVVEHSTPRGTLRIRPSSVRLHGCEGNDACHDSLWGQWMVKGADRFEGVMPDGAGGELAVVQAPGA